MSGKGRRMCVCEVGCRGGEQKRQGTFESLKTHRAVAGGWKEEVKLESPNPTGPCRMQSGV